MILVYVLGGTFTMDCGGASAKDCYSDEKPVHDVTVDGFWMGKYEITVLPKRNHAIRADIPIILITGMGEENADIGIGKEGIRKVIRKPVRKSPVLKHVTQDEKSGGLFPSTSLIPTHRLPG